MNILNELKKVFGIYPKNPNEFVKKFIKDSKKGRSQLQLIYFDKIILQVDPLKFVPSWFKVATKIDKGKYENGYVVFFVLDKVGIEKNKIYQKYKTADDLDMLEIEELHGETKVVTFAHFLKEDTSYLELATYLREVLDKTYVFKEKNPQLNFNIRYLNNYSG